MKKANFKAILAMLLVGVMGVSMTACSGNGDTASSGESSTAENSSAASASEELPDPVELNIASFRVGTHNAAPAETRYITEFQELYNGVDKQKITINIEEMPSDQEYYNQMLVRASSNTLPDVFEGNNGVLELAVQNGIAVDMNPYVELTRSMRRSLARTPWSSDATGKTAGFTIFPTAVSLSAISTTRKCLRRPVLHPLLPGTSG